MALDQELLSKAPKVVEKYCHMAFFGVFKCGFWCVLILFVVIYVCSDFI